MSIRTAGRPPSSASAPAAAPSAALVEPPEPEALEASAEPGAVGSGAAEEELLESPGRFLNRELSWLEFNRRVLAEAEREDLPLLERVKFVAIFGSNLDEFFMKRVGGLKQQLATGLLRLTPDGRTPAEQLEEIDRLVRPMVDRQRRILLEDLLPALEEHGVELLSWDDLEASERRHLERYFTAEVFPILTPLAVDPAHPFPFISNLSLSLAVSVRHPMTGESRFARIKVPHSLPRWVELPGSHRFVALEDVIAHNLERLFPGMEIVEACPFRVTRNADVQRLEETADDLLEAIQEELRERRFATVVRLEVVPDISTWMRELLAQELRVAEEDVHEIAGPLGLRDLMGWLRLPLHELKDRPWTPVIHPRLHPLYHGGQEDRSVSEDFDQDIFDLVRQQDILLHHPFHSFTTSVQRFIQRAAQDPSVLAIKQTFYRTSSNSEIMKALVRAAETHKQVAVSVEIKARFDEANNIEWAEALEKSGAHVAYGMVGLKTHAKLALVVRQERSGLACYAHIGTGNYNSETANLYTDLGLMTADPEIATEVVQVFNLLTGYVHEPEFRRLLVAPVNMKSRFLEMIEREIEHQEAGRGGRIVAKMNGLEDVEVVDALYRASRAGVEIDLIVRGICRIRPGVKGLSETVRVVSIVGRFLEHTRVFCFGNGGAPEYYLGSADWMERNLQYRVEVVVPVDDPDLQGEIQEILDAQLADNLQAWDMASDGTYRRRRPAEGEPGRSSQEELMAAALASARGE